MKISELKKGGIAQSKLLGTLKLTNVTKKYIKATQLDFGQILVTIHFACAEAPISDIGFSSYKPPVNPKKQ